MSRRWRPDPLSARTAVPLDDLDLNALGSKIVFSHMGILGGNADMRPARGIIIFGQTGRFRHHHAAITELEIQRLIEILALLHQGILAHNTQIGAAVLNIRRHIGGPYDHVAHLLLGVLKDQLTGIGEQFLTINADGAKQGYRLFQNTTLGNGYGYPIVHSFTRIMSAPRPASFFSIDS